MEIAPLRVAKIYAKWKIFQKRRQNDKSQWILFFNIKCQFKFEWKMDGCILMYILVEGKNNGIYTDPNK